VSTRLKRSLQHPHWDSQLVDVQYSPDGRKIIAGDYPGGVVQVWDVESGRQLTKIETGSGFRGDSHYLHLTPDWSSLFVCQEKRKAIQFERDGKKMFRWEMDGGVRSWDLATGQLRENYRHDPPHSVRGFWLSPDGRQFATYEELPGESDGGPKYGSSLWDVKTKQHRALPEELYMGVHGFSPDSRYLFGVRLMAAGRPTEIKIVDSLTATVRRTISNSDNLSPAIPFGFSPDGHLLIARQAIRTSANDPKKSQDRLRLIDADTGQDAFSCLADPDSSFHYPRFSPDGSVIAVGNWRGAKAKLFLFDVARSGSSRVIALADKEFVNEPAFRPDGRWLAVVSQVFPDDVKIEPKPDEVAQARIHLIDVARGEIRETLICPPGFPGTPCFSPDGKTLATGGRGKVHLWDVSDLK
jgi:WD40 repeat protein